MEEGKTEKIEVAVVEDEELPTNSKKLLKILEIPVLGKDDMKNIKEVTARLNDALYYLEREHKTINDLLEKFDRLVTLIDADKERMIFLNEKVDNMVEYFSQDKTVEILSGINENLNSVLASIQATQERIVSLFGRTLDNMEFVSASISDLHGKKDEIDKKINLLVENISEKFDAHIQNLNNRLEAMNVQITEPLNDISLRIEEIKKISGEISRSDIETDISNAVRKSREIKKLGSDIKKISEKIDAIRSEQTVSQISAFIKVIGGYRVPKKAQADKQKLLKTLNYIENAVTDITIIKSVKGKMSLAQIKDHTKLGETVLKQRLSRLVADGKLKKEKKGRYFVYSVGK